MSSEEVVDIPVPEPKRSMDSSTASSPDDSIFRLVPSSDDEEEENSNGDEERKSGATTEAPPGVVQPHKSSLDQDTTTISQTSKEIRQAARRSRVRSISRQGSGLNRSRSRTSSSRRSRESSSRRRMTITDREKWTNAHSLVSGISVHHLNLPIIMKLKHWAKRAVKQVRKLRRMKKSKSSQSVLIGVDGKRRRYIADFFLICGIDDKKWDVTKNEETHSDLMMPSILQQYPENDKHLSIPPFFEAWALPDELHLVADSSVKDSIESKFHHAPLTDEKGSRYYLASLRMYVYSFFVFFLHVRMNVI